MTFLSSCCSALICVQALYYTQHPSHSLAHMVCSLDCSEKYMLRSMLVNTLRPRQNGRHFTDDIFKCIFFNENVSIAIKISLKFVPKGQINIIPALVQTMAWRPLGDKPLSEPMMVSLPMHICITRPQWVNSSPPGQNGCNFGRQHFQMHFFQWKW